MSEYQNKIEKLISELRPHGVELKKLGEIIRRNPFKQLGAGELGNLIIDNGDIKLLPSSKNYDWFTDEVTAGNYICEGEVITMGRARYANIKYWNGKFVAANNHIITSYNPKKVLNRYLYYFILNHVKEFYVETSTYPKLDTTILNKFIIPVPPLSIQEKIVEILDSFTELEAELEAELKARKKQYKYYRDELLNIENVEFKTLGEIGTLIRGNGLQKKDFTESGVGCVHYGQIYTYYGTFADKTKTFVSPELAKKLKKAQNGDVLISGVSENIEDVCKPLAWLGGEICISGDMFAFRHSQNTKFITYLLQTTNFYKYKERYAQGAKVTRVKADKILDYKIPVPPLSEQKRIVSILDKFDALVNDISIGLPAEIKARHQQYEYYRNKLLTFKEYVK